MTNIFLVALIVLSVFGCATHSEKTKGESSSNVSSKARFEGGNASSSQASNGQPEFSNPAAESDNEKLYHELYAAIVSKDDTLVEKTSAQLLAKNVNDVKTLNAVAMYHAQKGRYVLAEMLLNKVLKTNENSYVVYENLGWIQFQKGKKREGVFLFKKALELNPDSLVAASNLGSYFAEVKDYGKAQVILENVYKKGTKDINLINNYAISLMAMGENADAVFDHGMQLNASNLNFMINYGIYLVEVKKDFAKGKEILEKINFIGVNSDRRDVVKNLEEKVKNSKL